MKNFLPLAFLLICFFSSFGQNTPPIYQIEAVANETVAYQGDLAEGAPVSTLRWAWNSSVACFPETQAHKFTGNQVFYIVDLPRYSEMEVTVIPDDRRANFSIYAYEAGQITEDNLVPNLASCIRCEADHKWDRRYAGRTQDHTRTVSNLVAINNPYQVLIAVVGAEGLAEGTYTLQVSLKSR